MTGTLSFNQITIHNRWPCKYLMRASHGENESVLGNTHMHTRRASAQTAEPQRADFPRCHATKIRVIESVFI